MEVILINSLGLVIACETVNFKSEIASVINEWDIGDGDTIKFVGDLVNDTYCE